MSTILHEIVENRRQVIAACKSRLPEKTLRPQLTRSDRDFAAALRSPSPAFILECKKASPSRGLIRADFDLDQISRIYGKFASAISVLTEPDYFQGSLDNLRQVRAQVRQPVLCKDFIVEPYQVMLARHYGADAVLLILAILEDDQYLELVRLASELGMATLTEVSTENEQRRAIQLDAAIVGINNRNLRDMTIDLNTTIRLSGDLRNKRTVISESGYFRHEQVRYMSRFVDGFLVGSSLMADDNLEIAVKRIIFGDNKVCGLTRPADAAAAADSGAVYGGLIFAQTSRRRIDLATAQRISQLKSLRFVGVFQDQPLGDVAAISRQLDLSAVQLHGSEPPEFVAQLRDELGEGCEIWKAISVDSVSQWIGTGVDRLLVDNQTTSTAGGTGVPFDWSRLPAENRELLVVAGGLGPDNVCQAARLGCGGLDFNSGVESEPGVKDAKKINQVFCQLREYNG